MSHVMEPLENTTVHLQENQSGKGKQHLSIIVKIVFISGNYEKDRSEAKPHDGSGQSAPLGSLPLLSAPQPQPISEKPSFSPLKIFQGLLLLLEQHLHSFFIEKFCVYNIIIQLTYTVQCARHQNLVSPYN